MREEHASIEKDKAVGLGQLHPPVFRPCQIPSRPLPPRRAIQDADRRSGRWTHRQHAVQEPLVVGGGRAVAVEHPKVGAVRGDGIRPAERARLGVGVDDFKGGLAQGIHPPNGRGGGVVFGA